MDIVENKRFWRVLWVLGGLLGASGAAAQSRISLQQAGSRTGRDFTPVYEGREVVVSGQVNSRPILAADSYYLAIQDGTSYGLVLQGPEARFHDLEPGDWVEATGSIARRGGRPVLMPRDIHKLDILLLRVQRNSRFPKSPHSGTWEFWSQPRASSRIEIRMRAAICW